MIVAPPDVEVEQGNGGSDGVEWTVTILTGVRPSPTRRAVLHISQAGGVERGLPRHSRPSAEHSANPRPRVTAFDKPHYFPNAATGPRHVPPL